MVSIRRNMRMFSASGAVALGCGALLALTVSPGAAATSGSWYSKVLLVGTYHGKAGQFTTIQAAVNAAQPGDWILVGPGDYHENADETGPYGNPDVGDMGGVYISKSGITLRGMNRNTVIVDGTKKGSSPCSSKPSAQNYGRLGKNSVPVGRNGILVWKSQRRKHREPHRLQLHGRHGRFWQPDLVERRCRHQARSALPDTGGAISRRRRRSSRTRPPPPSTGSSPATRAGRRAGTSCTRAT